jgi:long-chain acyl-CoA synthetase
MSIDFLFKVFEQNAAKSAVVWRKQTFSYEWLSNRINYWLNVISFEKIQPGTVTLIEGDFSPNAIALFLALAHHQCILVPLTTASMKKKSEFSEIAQGQVVFKIGQDDTVKIEGLSYAADYEFYQTLRNLKHPGLVLFSSGSTGKSKATIHDLNKIFAKYHTPKRALRTITFLLYDHIGGVNTMLHTLANGGCVVTVEARNPDEVLNAIETYQVELLPTSPTFLNLILISEAYKRHDLSSLKTISYGTEPMPIHTLTRLNHLFPDLRLAQTYGLSEVGILSSKSKDSNSLWFKLQGEDFETRIVDGILHVKSQTTMLGYLNAPSPVTEDGWFNTGDAVEVDGDYVKVLGRKSEIINVGGEKVYPAEVENVIQMLDNVAEVTVYGEDNPITGKIVCTIVTLMNPEDPKQFSRRLQQYCRGQLQAYKVPLKVKVIDEKQYSERFKKIKPQLLPLSGTNN